MRRSLYIFAGALGTIVGSYLAWSRTEEGRLCGRMVRDELLHYSPVTEAESYLRGDGDTGFVQ